jgi:DNA-binding CsgD family transcriptional regulator
VIDLVDRDQERATLDRVLDAAASGLSGTCVLVGEAGMGKTRLLEYAVERAHDFRHVLVGGVEAESDLGYAALHRLLRPFLSLRDQLPLPQRTALESAFGLGDGEPPDRFLVGLACLSLLSSVADERQLLCVLDDAQWMDRESVEALSFVARRLQADGIAFLFGTRELASVADALDGLPTLSVVGLAEDAALTLLSSSVSVVVEPETAKRVVAVTGGCPLALIELASGLTEQQLRGGQPVGDDIPIGHRLEDHFLKQVRALDTSAQLFLLVGATESAGDPSLVRRAAFELGADSQAEDAALASGLMTMRPQVTFRHPLVRAAVYGSAPRALRDDVHLTLAAMLNRTDPDRRVRHLASAAREPNADLADELEEAALRAARRGGYAAEASLLIEAAQLSPTESDRAERRLRAASAALSAGMAQRAAALLEQALPELYDPLSRAKAMFLDGTLRLPLADPASAPARLLAAAEALAPLDRELARDAFLEALSTCAVAQHFTAGTTAEDVARAALTFIPRSSPPALGDSLLEGTAQLFLCDFSKAMPTLERVANTLRTGDVTRDDIVRWHNIVPFVANELGDDVTYDAWVQLCERQARTDGALIVLTVVLLARARAEVRAGRFTAAEMTYDEVVEITGFGPHPPAYYELLKCGLFAWRGREAETRVMAGQLREAGSAMGSAVAINIAGLAVATVNLGAGRYDEAYAAIEPMVQHNVPGWTSAALPTAIEAASRSGNLDAAKSHLSQVTARATVSKTDWALGQLARCRALVADDRDAEALHMEAIRRLASTSITTEALQARLAFGEWLRRQNRRVDARAQLRPAYDAFNAIGADGFASRARAELEAAGETVQQRSEPARTDLTPQEMQAARLAATGATNAEIAAQMYISANTVDYHLRKVYRKLDVSSRRDLRTAMPALDF